MTLADIAARRAAAHALHEPQEGHVADPPTTSTGFLRIITLAQPGLVREVPWMARADLSPQPGDAALLVEADVGETWCVAWWPQSGVAPTSLADLAARIAALEAATP